MRLIHRAPWGRLTRLYLMFLLLDLAFLVLAALPAAANVDLTDMPAGGFESEEVAAAVLRLGTGAEGYQPAIQLQARAHLRVTGLVAHVRLEQTFRNDTGNWVEGEYLFPLPDDAAVTRLELVIGERRIVGEVREKQEARKLYEQARATGHKASLVEQRRPNLFSNKIANIAPGETVSVALDYVQRVTYRDGEFQLRFPMTVTPRYSPRGHPGAAEVWQFLNPVAATAQNPIQAIQLSADINLGLPLAAVDSAYHPIAVTRQGSVYSLKPSAGAVPMDRDFLLRWRPRAGAEPLAAVFHERIGAAEYALLMVLPPPHPAPDQVLPREVIFVIDTSGSMGGSSITQARASLDFGLRQLTPRDRFNIVEFNSDARLLFPDAVAADTRHIARARQFVRHLDAGGGTEMRKALELALPTPIPESADFLRQVVFITDGAVGNEVGLFRDIEQRLGASRLFTVGIGSAPNSWFMRKAAQMGQGDFMFIGDILEVQERMQALFTRLGQTLMADLDVEWPVDVETWPAKIPDLYPGEPLMISARATDSLQGSTVTVRGRGGSERWERSLPFAPPPAGFEQAYTGIGTLWARAKIASLLDEKILGRDAAEVRAAVLPIALEHQIASPYTSFLAVEQQPSRPQEEGLDSKPVPNLRPHGQSPQPYAYPRTATPLRLHLVLALVMLLCACAFWRSSAWAWR